MRKLFLLIALLLSAQAAWSQGYNYRNIALNGAGQPLAGVSIAVCAPTATTAANVTNNIAAITLSGASPATQGFAVGGQLTVAGFTSGDTVFNGTFSVLALTNTQVIYALQTANHTATSNGTALQEGTTVTMPCGGLVPIYTDYRLTTPAANPFTADGLGNYYFSVAPSVLYIQTYGPSITTQFFQATIPCVESSSCGGGGGGSVSSVGFAAPTGLVVTGSPITSSGILQFAMPVGWTTGYTLIGNGANSVTGLAPGANGTFYSMVAGLPQWVTLGTNEVNCQINYGDQSSGTPLTTGNIQPQFSQCLIPQTGTMVSVVMMVASGASTVQLGYRHNNATTTITGVLTPAVVAGVTYPVVCANVGGSSQTIEGVSVTCGVLTNTPLTGGDYIETIGGAADGTSEAMSIAVTFTQPGGSGGGGGGSGNCGQSWSGIISYGAGCSTTYSGNVYVSLINSNSGNEPDISPTEWQTNLQPVSEFNFGQPGYNNRFVATWGSDSNDGLSWGTAKATWDAACETLNGGLAVPMGAHYCGQGTIYITDGIAACSNSAYGIQLVGDTGDPNAPYASTCWENITGPIETIGVGCKTSSFSSGNPVCQITGGNASDIWHPGLWMSANDVSITWRNVDWQGQGRDVVLGQCTDHTEPTDGACAVDNTNFWGVATLVDQGSSSGPGWYFGTNDLWIQVNNYSIEGNATPTVTADNAQAVVIGNNGGMFQGFGAIAFNHGIESNGGIKVWSGVQGTGTISVTDLTSENRVQAMIWLAGPFGGQYHFEDIKAPYDCLSGGCRSIQNDTGAPVPAIDVYGPIVGLAGVPTPYPLGNPTTTATTVNTFGFISPNKFRAQSDAAAREFPAVTAISSPLISSTMTAGNVTACGTCTITTGKTDPSGGTNAIQISDTSGGGESHMTATGDGSAVVGDSFIYSIWAKPVTGNCCNNGGILVFRTFAAGDVCTSTGDTFAAQPPYSNAPAWQHYIGICKLSSYTSSGAPNLSFETTSTSTIQYSMPQIILLHTATFTDSEINEVALNLGTWSSTCTAGQLCSVIGPVASGSISCSNLPSLTGDTTTTAGSCATTTSQINGGAPPASATVTATNSSRQIIAATPTTVAAWLPGCNSTAPGTVPATGGNAALFLNGTCGFTTPPGAAPAGSAGNIQTYGTSTTLAALSPTDCSAGQATTGINANGASQGCFTPYTASAFLVLTDAATVAYNVASAPNPKATVTLGGNRSLAVTNQVNGSTMLLDIVQDGTGTRTLTLSTGGTGGCTSWAVAGTGTAIVLSTNPGTTDQFIWTDHAGVCEGAVIYNIGGTSPATTGTICSGTIALGTTLIASGATGSTSTATCTGLLSTDNIELDFNTSPLAVTGYASAAGGVLTIVRWPTTNTINVAQQNNTGSGITPGAITMNYRVVR